MVRSRFPVSVVLHEICVSCANSNAHAHRGAYISFFGQRGTGIKLVMKMREVCLGMNKITGEGVVIGHSNGAGKMLCEDG